MRYEGRCFISVLMTVGSLFLVLSLLFASITNEGNDAVQIDIAKESGAHQMLMLYPGQTVPLPSGASEVTVLPFGYIRGDEEVKVTVVEPDGTEGSIEKIYGVYRLAHGEKKKEKKQTVLQKGVVHNRGNINVDIEIIRQNGTKNRRQLILEETVSIPKDTVQVKVTTLRPPRSDEKVEVEVEMPDGTSYTIRRAGGFVRLKNK